MYESDLNHKNDALHEKLQALYALSRGKRMALGFREAYLNLLEKFGNPHENLPPTIHVAGTNGKGSSIAFMKAMLEASGRRVHVYTSPHLVRFNERIVLNGVPIDDDALEALIDEALTHNDGADVTFFEITTAMAMAAFVRVPADVVLMETGLGGRLDCTNVIPCAAACLITPVSFDHTEFLGETIQDIAREKAGIIKHGVPCISAIQPYEETYAVLQDVSLHQDAPFLSPQDAWNMTVDSDGFSVAFRDKSYRCTMPQLQGLHQIQNAASAIVTLQSVFDLDIGVINEGLQTVQWLGRMQDVSHLFDGGDAWQVYYDGGHNPAAGCIIAECIQNWGDTHVIIGMMKGKDAKGFIDPIMPHAKSITAITIPGEPMAMRAEEIATHTGCKTASSLQQAIRTLNNKHNSGRIVICGSLYLARHVMSTP